MKRNESWAYIRELKHKRQPSFQLDHSMLAPNFLQHGTSFDNDSIDSQQSHVSTPRIGSPAPPAFLQTNEQHPAISFSNRNDVHNLYLVYGVACLGCTFVIFFVFCFSLLSKLFVRYVDFPSIAQEWTDMDHVFYFLAHDWYYMLLFPLLVPVFLWFIYINWLGMKFFKHS